MVHADAVVQSQRMDNNNNNNNNNNKLNSPTYTTSDTDRDSIDSTLFQWG